MAKLHEAEKLNFLRENSLRENTGLIDQMTADAFLKPLCQIDWDVHAKARFAEPKAALAYLGRYPILGFNVRVMIHRSVEKRSNRPSGPWRNPHYSEAL